MTIFCQRINLISLPILLSSLAVMLINLLSIPILGNYGIDEMAAAAIAASIMMIFTNVFLASFTGFRILGSKAYGANDIKRINLYANNGLLFAINIAIILSIILYFTGDIIIDLMSQEESIKILSFKILKINALSLPVNALTCFFLINFNLQKNTKYSLYVTLIANIVGIAVSIMLVYGYSFIPSYGATGAAWAGFIENI